MKDQLFNWLESMGITLTPIMQFALVIALILTISLVIHVVLHYVVIRSISRGADKSKDLWQRALFARNLFSRLAFTLQGVIIYIQTHVWLEAGTRVQETIELLTLLWILLYSLLSIFAILDTILDICQGSHSARKLPLRGIFQGIKLIGAVISVIVMVSLLIGKSPIILFSGLGAMTAVLLLVFRDPIMGLVAGIQLSADNMLMVGDWLEMPKYGADGDVIDITLATVKVRNWDRTVTTVPTYALISDSFKNWRGMTESGGRRIKRALNIDVGSVRFLDKDELEKLRGARLLTRYIEDKSRDIDAYNREQNVEASSPVNARRLTNLGTFRAYLAAYIKNHKGIHQEMIQMVRQLDPTPNGIPIEVYAFSNNINWVDYEGIQSDIFDHIFAVLPEFGLRVHQTPTGYDLQQLRVRPRSDTGKAALATVSP
jgi:miniconductance mechanosensitive channel